MSDGIRLSIALVTRNRPDSLRRSLASLRAQEVQPHEIIVSDDSDDPTQAAALAAEFGARHVIGPRRGLYANRNAAALACTGTHIRSMDDDHTFSPGHLARCLEFVQGDPVSVWTMGEISFVGGSFSQKADTPPQLHASGVGGPVHDLDDNWAISDGSTIYPRSVFDQGLRMVEEFGFGSSYLEFGALLKRRGFRCRCMREVWIEHHVVLAELASRDQASVLFASLCFNLHFRPNRLLAARYLAGYLARSPVLSFKLARVLELAHERWAFSSASLAPTTRST